MSEQLTREEVAAMWLYSHEYAYQALGIREWWAQLPDHRKRKIRQFLAELDAAERAAHA